MVTLDQCIELFTQPETLSKEEAWSVWGVVSEVVETRCSNVHTFRDSTVQWNLSIKDTLPIKTSKCQIMRTKCQA